jgi:hypothetical protein
MNAINVTKYMATFRGMPIVQLSRETLEDALMQALNEVARLQVELDEARKPMENLMYMPHHDRHDNLEAINTWLASHPKDGEK